MLDINKSSFVCFIPLFCGLISAFSVNIVGQIYVVELFFVLLNLFLIISIFLQKSLFFLKKPLLLFIFFAALSLLGYIIADISNYTSDQDSLRGWSRLFFLIVDIISLTYINSLHSWNIWWYCIGSSIGQLLTNIIKSLPFYIWKLGYGEPSTLLAICLGLFLIKNLKKLSFYLFFLSILNLVFDYRSVSFFLLLTSIFTWVKAFGVPSFKVLKKNGFIVIIILLLFVFAYNQSQEFISINASGSKSKVFSSDRRSESNSGRSNALETGLEAIYKSPLVGHGSWAKDRELAQKYIRHSQLEINKIKSLNSYSSEARELIPSHSQLLQSWIEGGILGATFFIYFIYKLAFGIKKLIANSQFIYSPLLLFILISSLWAVFFSPFAGFERLSIALSISVLCLLDYRFFQKI